MEFCGKWIITAAESKTLSGFERMAFIQRLSVKEKPVIVLDDIFLALDNQMQKKAFNMIGRISQDFQIIYLSCHEYAIL